MARQRASSVATTRLFTAIGIVAIAVMTAGCDLLPRPPPPTSADYCGVDVTAPSNEDNTLHIWAPAPRQHCLRLYALYEASQSLPDISVIPVEKNINSTPYFNLIKSAAEKGNAPDIAFYYNGSKLEKLIENGYLYPLEKCKSHTARWNPDLYIQGKWSLPFEVDANVLFYSKVLLRETGWSENDINKLPDRIAAGEFTLKDLTEVAIHALNNGIVEKGYAYLPPEQIFYPLMGIYNALGGQHDLQNLPFSIDKAILEKTFDYYLNLHHKGLLHKAATQRNFSNLSNRLTVRDAIAHGRILFAVASSSEWKRMQLDHISQEDVLSHNIGMALLPALNNDSAGRVAIRSIGSHFIFNQKATGRENQQQSCKLLQQLHKTRLVHAHAVNTSQVIPVFNSLLPTGKTPQIQSIDISMAKGHQPEFVSFYHSVVNALAAVIDGQITTEDAAAIATSQYTPPNQ